MDNEKSEYTVAEISELLSVNKETVRRWIRSGKLKGTCESKRQGVKVNKKDLEQFLQTESSPLNVKNALGVLSLGAAAMIPGIGIPVAAALGATMGGTLGRTMGVLNGFKTEKKASNPEVVSDASEENDTAIPDDGPSAPPSKMLQVHPVTSAVKESINQMESELAEINGLILKETTELERLNMEINRLEAKKESLEKEISVYSSQKKFWETQLQSVRQLTEEAEDSK